MLEFVTQKILRLIKGIKNPKITILGLAYKGGVDDTRESQAIKVIEVLKSNGEIRAIQIAIYDPT